MSPIIATTDVTSSEHMPISGRHVYQEVGRTPSQDTATSTFRRPRTYRGGFHTSICDIFRDPHSRTDCCAVACCGVFSSDRNRYLLTGERPPPLWHRVLMYFVVPFLFIGAIGYFAVEVPVEVNGGNGKQTKVPRPELVWSFVAYIIFISIWGRWVSALLLSIL